MRYRYYLRKFSNVGKTEGSDAGIAGSMLGENLNGVNAILTTIAQQRELNLQS